MRKILSVVVIALCSMSLTASRVFVATTGNDSNDGMSWALAKATVSAGISVAEAGDTVCVAAGTYNLYFALKDGVQLLGSYNAATGQRNFEVTPTIIDGTDLDHYLFVKYDNACTMPTHVDGFIFQNANHSSDGGAGYIRANCFVENCIVRNCTTSGGSAGIYNDGGTISNCLFELCYAEGNSGAVRNVGGLVENCIFRGCQGKYATVRNDNNGVVRNCLFYNNQPSTEDWPASGGVYNPQGRVYNCTFACNYGEMYAGSHSDNVMYNCVFWNNKCEDGFSDPSTYISSSSVSANGSGNNAGDNYFEASAFSFKLAAGNMDAKGPHFVSPTSFVGVPTTAGQIAAMRSADFSLLAASPVIDKGRSSGAPSTDIEGTARPCGAGVDMGCYEFNPNAPVIAVEGVAISPDTMFLYPEDQDAFTPIFTPGRASNRNVNWTIANTAVATIDSYGVVTALTVGTTYAYVVTAEGHFRDTAVIVVDERPIVIIHPDVLLCDSLYPQTNYTVPSFTPFWIARETARRDSTEENLAAMWAATDQLVDYRQPYNIVANINGDPTTRMAFTWWTNANVSQGVLQIIAKDYATDVDFETSNCVLTYQAVSATTKALPYAVSTSGIIKATGMDKKTAFSYVVHKTIVDNLMPGTAYSYRVGFDDHWSDIYRFRTEEENQGEFSFLYMSDSHLMNELYVNRAHQCAAAAANREADANFCLFPGDFVETGTRTNSEWEWERWFEYSIKPILSNMPVVPTDGNHDDTDNLNYNLHFNTDAAFNSQSKVKPQFSGITYAFQYGDVLFLVYSLQDYWRGSYSTGKGTSTYLTNDVGNWFREQCAKFPKAKYRICLSHKNVFSGSGHQEDDETPLFRDCMLPIYKECEIDLAIQGHDHCYEVIGPVDPDTRKAIYSAISDVDTVDVNTNSNMTGLQNGTYCTDDGTLYFIGATCGEKRYYPYTREEMEANYDKTKVENYFDLFTGLFGQPGNPSFSKFTYNEETGLTIQSYTADEGGNTELINTMRVVRTKPHTVPNGYETVESMPQVSDGEKFVFNGKLYIRHNDIVYASQGQVVK